MRSIAFRAVLLAVLLFAAQLRPASALDIQRVTSPGGIEAWLVEDHSNPILTLAFSFAGGQSSDPAGKEGRARMVSGLLDEGAGPLDSTAFQKALADDSITLRFSARSDRFSGRLTTLTETRDQATELLRLSLTEPRFDAEPVERIRAQILAGLRRSANDPRTLARRAFWAANFPDHAYGRPSDGTMAGVAAVDQADLKVFVAEGLTRDRLLVTAVGDVDAATLGALLDRVFGGLHARGALPKVVDAAPAALGQTMVIEEKVPQSAVVFGHAGIPRADKDWYAASILNEVMAGGFGSRLTEEIREKRGLVYGVYAYPLPLDHAPMMLGGLASNNAKVAEAVALVRQEWARMAKDGPTRDEVERARTYLIGSFPLQLTDSDGVASILLSMRENDLGIDYLDRRRALFEAVTAADLKRVAARLYKPADLSVVVAGEPQGITPTRAAPQVRETPTGG